MKTKIFILGVQEEKRDRTFEAVLQKTFQPVLAPGESMQCYASVKDATAAIGRAFSESDSVFFFVDAAKYGDLKQVLCRAFGLELNVDEKLLLGAQRTAPELEEKDLHFSVAHAGVPANADVFVLSDSLYAAGGRRSTSCRGRKSAPGCCSRTRSSRTSTRASAPGSRPIPSASARSRTFTTR